MIRTILVGVHECVLVLRIPTEAAVDNTGLKD